MTGWRDPTYGRIDRDIQQAVDEWGPKNLGQRVAVENTMQNRREAERMATLDDYEQHGRQPRPKDRPDPILAKPSSLIGKRVRAVLRGRSPGIRVDNFGERIEVTSRTVVVGTVVGFETYAGQVYLDIAGHGRVPIETVRRARRWHRG